MMQINSIGIASTGITVESSSADASQKSAARFPRTQENYATLSTDGPAVDALVARAMQTSPTRLANVQELRAAVKDGTYAVDPPNIASAMVKELAGQG